jgi:hypothetical protein
MFLMQQSLTPAQRLRAITRTGALLILVGAVFALIGIIALTATGNWANTGIGTAHGGNHAAVLMVMFALGGGVVAFVGVVMSVVAALQRRK